MSEEVNQEPVENIQEVAAAPVSFRDALPAELREDSTLADIKDIESLAKGYVSAQRMLGSSVRIPGEDAGAEQLEEFYSRLKNIPGLARIDGEDKTDLFTKLGRPESHEGYKINIPDGMDVAEPETLGEFKKLSHELGLTQEQVSKIAEFDMQREAARTEEFTRNKASAETQLKEMWGADFNTRLEGAKATARVIGEQFPDAMKDLIHGEAGNNPALLSILSQLGASLQESGSHHFKNSTSYGVTPAEAMEKVGEIMGNKAHPYHHRSDPGHTAAVERVQQLYGLANPG